MSEKNIQINVVASEGPSFAAYMQGAEEDGVAYIALNLKLCLANDKDPKGLTAEVLAHEVLHVCQDILGQELTESDINAALAKLTGEEYVSCESEEQIQQEQLRLIQELGIKVEAATYFVNAIRDGKITAADFKEEASSLRMLLESSMGDDIIETDLGDVTFDLDEELLEEND